LDLGLDREYLGASGLFRYFDIVLRSIPSSFEIHRILLPSRKCNHRIACQPSNSNNDVFPSRSSKGHGTIIGLAVKPVPSSGSVLRSGIGSFVIGESIVRTSTLIAFFQAHKIAKLFAENTQAASAADLSATGC
jgi:hypothetical protein